MKPELSIIITNHNTTKFLVQCLQSIFKYTKDINFEVIVVDDNSKDQKKLKDLRDNYPKVKFVLNKKNVGFSSSNNIGIKNSKGKYILTLNSDTEIVNNLFSDMLASIKKDKSIAALTVNSYTSKKLGKSHGEAYKKEMTPIALFLNETFYAVFHFLFPKIKLFNKLFATEVPDKDKSQYVTHINGSCAIYNRLAIDEIGLFNPDYFIFCSETEWCKKARERGYRLYYLASSYVIHKGGKSFNMVSVRSKIFDKDYTLFVKKNYPNQLLVYKFLRIVMLPINSLFIYLGKKMNN